MNRVALAWLVSPSILGCLSFPLPLVIAAEVNEPQPAPQAGSAAAPQAVEIRVSGQAPEHPMLEFTEEESNSAIALFGCDCPAHLNKLRQLRGQPLLQ